MKRSMSILIALALMVSLASCTFLDELLSVNIFEETFELSAADAASASVGDLLAQSESEAFYKTVGSDPAVKTAVLGKTADIINPVNSGDFTTFEIQEAGILGASVIIYTSPAGDLLANAAGLADSPTEGISTIDELLDLVLPASVYSGDVLDETAFREMIDAFVDANAYYEAIGSNLDGDYLTTSASAGDIAVGAFIAAAIGGLTIPVEYTDAGEYLYAVLTDDAITPPDFVSPNTDTGYLANILDAANLGDLLDL